MADTEQDTFDPTDVENGAEIFEDAKAEKPRDEKGRFAKAEAEPEAEEAAPEVEAEPEAQPEPEPERIDHRIPLTELLNEREKRQAEQRRAEQALRELEELRKQLQPQQQQPVPDQFANPEAYNQYWEQRLEQERMERAKTARDLEANFSLRLARMQHGELFDQAYNAVMEAASKGDRAPAQHVANSPDPGDALVKWYKREQTLEKVGTDPEAYVQKALEEALNNPEFLAKALEKAKGVATAQPTQKVKLPPSLNKATSAGRADDNEGTSDLAVYRHAIGR